MLSRTSNGKSNNNYVFFASLLLVLLAVISKNTQAFQISTYSPQQQHQRHLTSNFFRQEEGSALYSTRVSYIPLEGGSLSSSSSSTVANVPTTKRLNKLSATICKLMMMTYIISICLTIPVVLLPQRFLPMKSKIEKEILATTSTQLVCRWLFKLLPFCNINCITPIDDDENDSSKNRPEPTVWVCNHTSMLDVFLLLACDKKLRGKNRRPIKIVYWKQLEDNPITKMIFHQAGFIPVDMEANANGEANVYNPATFKEMLKLSKKAFEEGFDLGILPEGQLNPNPEKGLLPIFSGAFTLARMSKRPIQMMALHGVHNLWHPNDPMDNIKVKDNKVSIRVYPSYSRRYKSADEFKDTFEKVVGHFGMYGNDIHNVDSYLNGSIWKMKLQKQKEEQGREKDGASKLQSTEA